MSEIQDILLILVQAIILAVIPIITKFVVDFLQAKSGQIIEETDNEYINNIIFTVSDVVSQSVLYVSQTYVNALKAEGKFDLEEQKIALQMAYDRIMLMIDEESKDVLTAVFGDLSLWVHTLIEAIIISNKDKNKDKDKDKE